MNFETFKGIRTGKNKKLADVLDRVKANKKLQAVWIVQNVTAIRRLKMNDHGHIHMRIAAQNALKIAKILKEHNISFNIEKDYKDSGFSFGFDDVEVVLFLSAILHDSGMSIYRKEHPLLSVIVANPLLDELLRGIYDDDELMIVKSEVLHCLFTHEKNRNPLTMEASVIRLADALDMEEGRARIPFNNGGDLSIHAVSAMAIERVFIEKGTDKKPIRVFIKMKNSAGIFQITELLAAKLKDSLLKDYVKIDVDIRNEEEKIIKDFTI